LLRERRFHEATHQSSDYFNPIGAVGISSFAFDFFTAGFLSDFSDFVAVDDFFVPIGYDFESESRRLHPAKQKQNPTIRKNLAATTTREINAFDTRASDK
jgi:hypothetical protein